MIDSAKFGATATTLLAIGATAIWLGCGVKSQPISPEDARPQQITDLQAASVSNGVELTWNRPEAYANGARMRDLRSFAIARSENKGQFQQIGEVQVTDQQRFQVQRTFKYLDTATTVGTIYDYRVVSRTDDGYLSQPSNDVILKRTIPPPPPNPETYMLPTPTPIPSLP